MSPADTRTLEQRYLMQTYRRAPVEEVYVKSFSVIFTLAYAFN